MSYCLCLGRAHLNLQTYLFSFIFLVFMHSIYQFNDIYLLIIPRIMSTQMIYIYLLSLNCYITRGWIAHQIFFFMLLEIISKIFLYALFYTSIYNIETLTVSHYVLRKFDVSQNCLSPQCY